MAFESLPLLLAFAAIVLPLVLAWVLLSRPSARPRDEDPERRADDGCDSPRG
ncbi:MAG: hypothetical protein H7Y61_05065 [Rhizobiales bacterium]|nr:hypothetical protein [Rhizobacter sp.]